MKAWSQHKQLWTFNQIFESNSSRNHTKAEPEMIPHRNNNTSWVAHRMNWTAKNEQTWTESQPWVSSEQVGAVIEWQLRKDCEIHFFRRQHAYERSIIPGFLFRLLQFSVICFLIICIYNLFCLNNNRKTAAETPIISEGKLRFCIDFHAETFCLPSKCCNGIFVRNCFSHLIVVLHLIKGYNSGRTQVCSRETLEKTCVFCSISDAIKDHFTIMLFFPFIFLHIIIIIL